MASNEAERVDEARERLDVAIGAWRAGVGQPKGDARTLNDALEAYVQARCAGPRASDTREAPRAR
jgi:hypothetical protein